MSEPSPRPWRCECGPTVNSVIAANGAVVVPHTGYAANAALIVAAVNERDRLRTEVKEAGELLQTWLCEAPGHRETVAWLKRNGFDDPFPECTEKDNSQ